MTYKDEASYGSSPPCIHIISIHIIREITNGNVGRLLINLQFQETTNNVGRLLIMSGDSYEQYRRIFIIYQCLETTNSIIGVLLIALSGDY